MKIISWNINGLRSIIKKGFGEFLSREDADVICLQEIRAHPEQVELDLPNEYEAFWNPAQKKGYSGTMMLTRVPFSDIQLGLGIAKHDGEGRVLTAELEHFFLVTVYVPNSQRGLSRLGYRMKWDVDFRLYLKQLSETKPVIFCGDLNVAHEEIDLANPEMNRRNAGFTDEERAGLRRILEAGFIDTFREFVSEGGHYTWWTNRGRAREKNIGWRIDYFCISRTLLPMLRGAAILSDVTGSDHCPISLEIDI